jgi:hypothetical protein
MALKFTARSVGKEELIGYANLYLDTLATNDPSRLPVTDDLRFTENTKLIKLGEGPALFSG